MIHLKYIDKILKDHQFSVHYLCKTLIVLMILISFSGYFLSCSALPNLKKTEDKVSINNGERMEKEEIEDKEYQIFAYKDKKIYLLTLSKDKKIIREINAELDGEIRDFEISPDGKKVLLTFSPAVSRHQNLLYVMNIDGTEKIDLTDGMWGGPRFSFSPDGKKVTFIGQRLGFSDSLYLVNIDGTERIDLLEGMEEIKKGIEGKPVFSPDGRKILFRTCRDESGVATSYLYIYDLDKKKVETIVKNSKGLIRICHFTPDSKKILFLHCLHYFYFYPMQLDIINIDGTERKNIAESVKSESVVISPDGKKVAFIRQKSGYSPDFVDSPNPSLCLVNIDGTEMKNLLNGMGIQGEVEVPLNFSFDSGKILFCLKQLSSESLCIFDLNKKKVITLIEAKDIKEHHGYQFSPDDRKILFVASFKEDEVAYFIGTDNFTGEPIYHEYTRSRHLIINNDGSSMISIEEIVLTDIIYAAWIPHEKSK